jgi:RNA polymerase sigma factor (sigma-70 family)
LATSLGGHTLSISRPLSVAWRVFRMRIAAHKLIAIVAPETSDAELLMRFTVRRDEAAFEELVRRHGPAVQRVCRRLVGSSHADDAFQAVFLVLACRAKAVRKAASVGSWLIGVAGRVARQMRQQLRKRQLANLSSQVEIVDTSLPSPDSHLIIPELAAALDEELTRLPDFLRAPVVLCLVEGRTQEQAVAELGGSQRTLRRRLERAKALLRLRLERRGVVPAVIAALIGNMQTTSAVSPELVRLTVHEVFEFLAGGGVRSAPAAIAKGLITNMTTFKAAFLVPVAALVLIGLGVVWAQDRQGKSKQDPLTPVPNNSVVTPGTKEKEEPAKEVISQGQGEASHRSASFLVAAPTPTIARAIAAEAEYQRAELAKLWLGKELPAWQEQCHVDYFQTNKSINSFSTFSFGKRNDGRPAMVTSRIQLHGDFVEALTNELPHNVMHVVMASHFRKPLPRWADEGLVSTAKPVEVQKRLDELCRQTLNAGRGIRLRKLLTLKEYPENTAALFSEGSSIVRFLIAQKVTIDAQRVHEVENAVEMARTHGIPLPAAPQLPGKQPEREKLFEKITTGQQQFLVFLHMGILSDTIDSWNQATKTVYGYETVDVLEEVWLGYLRRPESFIQPPGKLPNTTPKPENPDLIPPTTLPGTGQPPEHH